MTRKKKFKKLSSSQKVNFLILLLGVVLLLSIGIPTIARFKNRSTLITNPVWDGSIASSYRSGSGTEIDPYIISTGAELAYFYTQLLEHDYENTYFALKNDVVLNGGIFKYDIDNGIQYILNDQTYYVDHYTNKYYDNVERTGTEVGTINIFNPLNGFKGHFDGRSFRIYGLYMTTEDNTELALFTDLKGNIYDLYVENSIIYGGTITGGVAGTASNASLTNILYNGYVIGKNSELTKNISITPTASVIEMEDIETTNYIDLTNNIPFTGSEIISTSISGNYVIDGPTGVETLVKINGVTVTGGSFDINLGSSILESIPVVTYINSEEGATLTFSNLSYNIVYNHGIASGITAISSNVNIENTINKAYVYGYSISGGIVGVATNLTNINQSYNVGDINSEYVSGGLISVVEKSPNNIVIDKSYNAGNINASNIGGFIGIIDNNLGSVSINNAFNASPIYSLGTIRDTSVNINNTYAIYEVDIIYSGYISGFFYLTYIENFKNKEYVINHILFSEFIDFDDLAINSQNVWVFEQDSLPILFIDDLNKPLANIHVSVYSWNNLSYDLSPVKLEDNITFSIEEADDIVPFREAYYYISNRATALTKDEILQIDSWNLYSEVVQITEEGTYVIYAKVIDYNDNIIYINTDLLILDLYGASVDISIDNYSWPDLRDSLDYIYIDRPKQVAIEANDAVSGVASIKYYITDQILGISDLEQLNDDNWTTYSNPILINQIGTSVIYAKVVDNYDHVTYANTDYLVFDGYTITNLIIGRNANSYLDADPYITNKSTITLNIRYNRPGIELNDHTHNLISTILLPVNTKITLIDHIMEKVYQYQISTAEDLYNYHNSCEGQGPECIKVATYPFTLFREVGAINKSFVESTYYQAGQIDEYFTIILDLSKTNLTTNYSNVTLFMELHDENGNKVRPTLYETIEPFHVYADVGGQSAAANLFLTTDYSGDTIIFNSDSISNINITSGLNYQYIDGIKIIDTTYEDKNIGLAIKLVDSAGVTIDKEYLRSVIFKVGDNEYYPGNDSIVRINLNSGIATVTKTLSIATFEHNCKLKDGTYYFKITNYAAVDGYYYESLGSNELTIPVSISNDQINIDYRFDVMMDDNDRIINKASGLVNVTFNILQEAELDNPNIKVSLYQKDQLTAYNQTYSIVDLADYVNTPLIEYVENIYYVTTDPASYNEFSLTLITNNFDYTGYKLVFDLCDGIKKVGTIEKYFIVK